jgi:MFS family permease
VCGSLLLVTTLSFLPHVTSLSSFILLYVLVQFFSNISSSANLAFLPDLVPKEQLGRASGLMGALGAMGQLVGATSGMLVTTIGMQGVYWMISVLYLCTTAVTVYSVVEPAEMASGPSLQHDRGARRRPEEEEETLPGSPSSSSSASRSSSSGSKWSGLCEGLCACYVTYTDAIIHNSDFRWVFITRLLYNMGIYSVQEFLQYYVHDMLPMKGWSSTSEVSMLFVPLLCGAIVSAYFAGRLSDKWGGVRKKFIYASGFAQTVVCLLLTLPNSSVWYTVVAALAFGLASGCYAAVDFAMVLDVLPNSKTIARDLGVWHVSLVLPQLLSTPLSGSLLDAVRKNVSVQAGYSSIFFLAGFWFFLSTVLVVKIRGVK